MICNKLNNLYWQCWMCFEYVERFPLLLNDLNGSMKLYHGKHSPEDCHRYFLPGKSAKWTLPCKETALMKIQQNCFATNKKNRLSLKSKIMKKRLVTYAFYKNLVEYIRITFDHRISLACRLFRTSGNFHKSNKNKKLNTSWKFW